jgi:hypothetical protein
MAERKSLKRMISPLSPEQEAFAKGINIPKNIARNISRNTEVSKEGKDEENQGRWITVTFKLPPAQVEQLSAISTTRRLKGKKPWKKQEIISQALAEWVLQQNDG